MSPPAASGDIWSGTGTVRHLDLEGGFFGIVSDDGTQFDVDDLPAAFQRDSLRIRFRLEEVTGMMSTRMWGRIARVVEIDSL